MFISERHSFAVSHEGVHFDGRKREVVAEREISAPASFEHCRVGRTGDHARAGDAFRIDQTSGMIEVRLRVQQDANIARKTRAS